jgi:hypothetical protein
VLIISVGSVGISMNLIRVPRTASTVKDLGCALHNCLFHASQFVRCSTRSCQVRCSSETRLNLTNVMNRLRRQILIRE